MKDMAFYITFVLILVNLCGYNILEFEFYISTSKSSNHNAVFIVHLCVVLDVFRVLVRKLYCKVL
jgi:hypothetical protein